MKILIITNLFPNSKEPTRGMYNKQMIAELSKRCSLEVIAPIPWYPLRGLTLEGKNSRNVPMQELMEGIKVYHPRYLMVPVIGRFLSGVLFYLSLLPKVKKVSKGFDFDLIFALWVYPDGFGSILLGKSFNKPVVVEALGTDINLYSELFLRKKLISWSLKKCEKVFAVSGALRDKILKLGVDENAVKVVLNGIDRNMFKPLDKFECRNELKLVRDKKIILFIGNLVPVKGIEYLIKAFHKIGGTDHILVLVGDGFLEEELKSQALRLGISEKVYFAGKQSHPEIPIWLNACDVFCLPSLNEGCPNVVLEALACGTPVVASSVGGIPEMIKTECEGILVDPGDSAQLYLGLKKALDENSGLSGYNKTKYQRTWSDVAADVFNELQEVLKKRSYIKKD
jgi:teichuronic acid biosynthesis glycosyltransferase TuaC